MHNLIILIFGILILRLESNAQIQSFYIKPSQTDAGYVAQDSHYIVYNTSKPVTKLVLFIGGSFSRPGNYNLFCDNAATQGYDVISLCYSNDVAAASLAGNSDSLAFNKYRQEIAFGTSLSPDVSVDSFNSIYTRTLKLLKYLQSNSSHDWGQYLINSTAIDWSKIIIAGHSQGSGHACYLAKKFPVDRAIMLSGPNDYSTFFTNSANWLRTSGLTPPARMFTLLHLNDEIVPFSQQYVNNKGLGMTSLMDTTLIDNLATPFNNAQFLYTKLSAISQHNSTVGAQPKVKEAWNYMLSKTITIPTNLIQNQENSHFNIYPNPVIDFLNIELTKESKGNVILIYNLIGKQIISQTVSNRYQEIMDLSMLSKGIYFLKIGDKIEKIVKD
jgi:pimeloyl-ACP methyl ester carboxylesterase